LPWDHIDVGLEDGFLVREYRKALASRLSPPCGKAVGQFVHHTNLEDAEGDARKLVCYDCGVACDLTTMREERLVALSQLGAKQRSPAKTEPVTMSAEERRPRASFAQGEAKRYRISFTRVGRAAFQSHLDLIRVVPRVFRRAEIPMFYSQGFHPKPEMVFGPALALGITTLDEYVDVKLAMDVDPETLCASLQPGALDGLTFVRAVRLGANDPAISKVVDTTVYVAAVPWVALRERGITDVATVKAAIDAKRAEPLVVVRKQDGGIGKKVDVGSYLRRAEAGAGGELLARAGFAGELLPVTFATRVTPTGACKPSEVFIALFDDALPVRFVRVQQGKAREDGSLVTPMELRELEVKPKERVVPVVDGLSQPLGAGEE
jgi:radical SAM-linked protein